MHRWTAVIDAGTPGRQRTPLPLSASCLAFFLGLLQGVYTITGFDASGHTSEETRNAAREVPKGMIGSGCGGPSYSAM